MSTKISTIQFTEEQLECIAQAMVFIRCCQFRLGRPSEKPAREIMHLIGGEKYESLLNPPIRNGYEAHLPTFKEEN